MAKLELNRDELAEVSGLLNDRLSMLKSLGQADSEEYRKFYLLFRKKFYPVIVEEMKSIIDEIDKKGD